MAPILRNFIILPFSLLGRVLNPLYNFYKYFKTYFIDILYSQIQKYNFCKPYPCFVSLTSPVFFNSPKYISVGEKVRISEYSTISAWDKLCVPHLHIGNNVRIGAFAHITCANEIFIGDGTLLGKQVTITDNSHGMNSMSELAVPPHRRKLFSKGKVVIGCNVWIGDKATILPGVQIGDNVIIGANSVVTKNIPSNSIACGNPAIIVKSISK